MFNNYQHLIQQGHVSKELLFKHQEFLFYSVLGYYPNLNKRYHSPFRDDKRPGCRFAEDKGVLYFIDNTRFKDKLRWNCIDCIIERKNLSYKQALNYAQKLVLKTFKGVSIPNKTIIPKIRLRPKIRFKWIPWTSENNYFAQYGISLDYIRKQPVYLVSEYWVSTTKDALLRKNLFGKRLCIAYQFKSNNVKLYFPESDLRFYSNCRNSDIFGQHRDYSNAEELLITKSGKDEMVFNHSFGIPTYGLQQETLPRVEYLKDSMKYLLEAIPNNTKRLYVWFDADETGIKESNKLCNFLSNQGLSCINIIHDNILGNDIADLSKNNNLKTIWKNYKI